MYPGVSLWLLLALLATAEGGAEPPWGDWIIVDDSEPGSSVLLRRITPKSVFVAPTFNGCSDGYRQDSLGRCVKVVNVDQQKQWSFFLERLNSMYAVTTGKSTHKEAGPFHVDLPLGEGSQEESIVDKRKPPKSPDDVESAPSTTTARPIPAPTTSSTAPESRPTPSAASDSSYDPRFVSSSTERRRVTTTPDGPDLEAMLGDQPETTEQSTVASPSKPKNRTVSKNVDRPEKPFVIIVTNEPARRTEETTTIVPTTSAPHTTEEVVESTSTFQPPSTTETADATTETSFPTDASMKSTGYDESFSETRDYFTEHSTDSNVRSDPTTVPPKYDTFSRLKDDLIDSSDCEPVETFVVSDERRRPASVPLTTQPPPPPPLEFARVRFPTETAAPVRNAQTFVRFPEASEPHEDRPSFWWPTWQVGRHPGVRGWPPPEPPPARRPPAPAAAWADAVPWRRRVFQRD